MLLALPAYMFLCVRVSEYVCILQCFCLRALEDFSMLLLASRTEENKHCHYYNNEYALGSK